MHPRAKPKEFLELEMDEHGIEELMVNPYADHYSMLGLRAAFENHGFKVKQSAFNLDPSRL